MPGVYPTKDEIRREKAETEESPVWHNFTPKGGNGFFLGGRK